MTLGELTEAYIRARLDASLKPKKKPEPAPVPKKAPPKVVIPAPVRSIYDSKRIIAATALAHGVSVEDILGRSRTRNVVMARHQATWMMRKFAGMSLVQISLVTNRVCHTSSVNSIFIVNKSMDKYMPYIRAAEATLASDSSSQLTDA